MKPGYEYNVARFMADHPGHVIRIGFENTGFSAQAKDTRGRAAGERIYARTLDELDAKLSMAAR